VAITHKMPPSNGPEWDQIIIQAPEFANRTRLKGGAHSACQVQCKHRMNEFI